MSPRKMSLADRLRFYAQPRGEDDCWIWSGSRGRGGYGQMRLVEGLRLATHISLELAGFPRPSKEHGACHRCDTPSCVNPKHLFWGTQKENFADCKAKGRMSMPPRIGVVISAMLTAQKMAEKCGPDHNKGDNTYRLRNGKTTCRRCKMKVNAAAKAKKRAKFTALGLTSRGSIPLRVSA